MSTAAAVCLLIFLVTQLSINRLIVLRMDALSERVDILSERMDLK